MRGWVVLVATNELGRNLLGETSCDEGAWELGKSNRNNEAWEMGGTSRDGTDRWTESAATKEKGCWMGLEALGTDIFNVIIYSHRDQGLAA